MLRRLLVVFVALPLLAVRTSAQSATTVCKDGTTTATTGRGACTGHGGVDKNAAKKAAAAAKAEQKAAQKAEKAEKKAAAVTMVTCGDGTSSKAGRGACARHGGVKPAGAMPAPSAAPAMRPAPASASAPARTMPAPAAARTAAVPAAPAPRPTTPTTSATHASNTDPTGATALCKDGTYSHAANHRGACARHQGVAKWL